MGIAIAIILGAATYILMILAFKRATRPLNTRPSKEEGIKPPPAVRRGPV